MICKNCRLNLHQNSDYCNKCGGKIIRNRLTFKNLFEHISETFFNYDNKLLRTLIDLTKQPETVIGGYISGVRKRYVNPISLFGLTLTLVSLEWLLLRKLYPNLLNLSALSVGGNESSLNSVFSFVQDYSSIIMMLLVPIYAIISRTVFFDKKQYNFVEHIVALIYMMAYVSLVGIVINFVFLSSDFDMGKITYINMPIQIIYISYCFKRLYKTSLVEIIGRAFMSFFVYIIIYIFIVAVILISIYLFEGKSALLEIFNTFKPK